MENLMIPMKSSLFGVFAVIFFLMGCGSGEERPSDSQMNLSEMSGIEIDGAWARPGSEGRMSAAYFLISNFNETADTLISVQSEVSRYVEIHESYESEEGMVGMREVQQVPVPGQATIRFEQGGLHVMLMQLRDGLSDGDTFSLILNFSNYGEVIVDVPVRL